MKQLTLRLLCLYVLFLLLLFGNSTALLAGNVFRAEKLDFEYYRLNPGNRNPVAPEYTDKWKERAALKWKVSILDHVYWDNNIHTDTIETGTVKTVGWQWEAGISLPLNVDIFAYHHSQHIMDQESKYKPYRDGISGNQFPVEDAYGIRIRFLK